MALSTWSGPIRSLGGFITQSTNANTVTVAAPASLSASYTITYPASAGTNGQVLTTDGAGVTSWTTNGAGTVTSVAGAGTINGLTLTGTVTSTGSLTLGGQFALEQSTAAAVGAIANAINTTGKYTGKSVVDLASGLIYTAVGATAGSVWRASNGTTTVTPS